MGFGTTEGLRAMRALRPLRMVSRNPVGVLRGIEEIGGGVARKWNIGGIRGIDGDFSGIWKE